MSFLCNSEPYPAGYSDYHGVFAGCTPNPSISGNLINVHAAYAIQAHACGTRQFFNGSCQNVAASCNTFDPLSGWCTSCADTSITPSSGVCASPSTALTCPTGQHQVGTACIPDTCSAANSAGQCTACISVLYQVVSGACTKKTCGSGFTLNSQTGVCEVLCASGQQRIGNACYNVPANCVRLTSAILCEGCIDPQKYQLVSGACKLCTGSNAQFPCVSCNADQIVSNTGKCLKKYSFCATINAGNGQCSACLSGNPPNNGYCCSSGAASSTGVCPSTSSTGASLTSEPGAGPNYANCRLFNAVANRCAVCKSGYDFVGSSDLCVLKGR